MSRTRGISTPASNRGSFAKTTHAPVAQTLTTDDALDRTRAAVVAVTSDFDHIDLDAEIPDHSEDGYTEDRWLTLADMADPHLAGGNCSAASDVLAEEWGSGEPVMLVYDGVPDGPRPGATVAHTAVQIDHGGVPVVIDITARQFDPDAPFPLVLERAAWERQISAWHADLGYGSHDPQTRA